VVQLEPPPEVVVAGACQKSPHPVAKRASSGVAHSSCFAHFPVFIPAPGLDCPKLLPTLLPSAKNAPQTGLLFFISFFCPFPLRLDAQLECAALRNKTRGAAVSLAPARGSTPAPAAHLGAKHGQRFRAHRGKKISFRPAASATPTGPRSGPRWPSQPT